MLERFEVGHYPIDFWERVSEARLNSNSNCIGTALFLLGCISSEHEKKFLNKEESSFYLHKIGLVNSKQRIIDIPNEAQAVGVWSPEKHEYWHLGVITPGPERDWIERSGSRECLSDIVSFEEGLAKVVVKYKINVGMKGILELHFLKKK